MFALILSILIDEIRPLRPSAARGFATNRCTVLNGNGYYSINADLVDKDSVSK
jgi:hypothetical protein